jgi:hypothetical protein
MLAAIHDSLSWDAYLGAIVGIVAAPGALVGCQTRPSHPAGAAFSQRHPATPDSLNHH